MKTLLKLALIALVLTSCAAEEKEEEKEDAPKEEVQEVKQEAEAIEEKKVDYVKPNEAPSLTKRWKVLDLNSEAEQYMSEQQRKDFINAKGQMLNSAFMEFKADGTFEGSLGASQNTGTWVLTTDGSVLTTTDKNGRADVMEVQELTNNRLIVIGNGVDNVKFTMTLSPAD
jgi:hypothetical protein